MRESTRVVRLGAGATRELADNGRTRVRREAHVPVLEVAGAFNAAQRRMAMAVREETRPGYFVFVLDERGRERGRLWLLAGPAVRAATFGRHGRADLYLPSVDSVSLRHGLVLVWLDGSAPRAEVMDLSAPMGLVREDGRAVGALTSRGSYFVGLPGLTLCLVPTGAGVPWDPLAQDPFSSLPPRVVDERRHAPGCVEREGARTTSVVRVERSPLAPAELLAPGDIPAGHLVLESNGVRGAWPVGFSALERGVLVGRYQRCVGARLLEGDGCVSRVHACLLSRGGGLVLADTGSTNGLRREGWDVRCEEVRSRVVYRLSGDTTLTWEAGLVTA